MKDPSELEELISIYALGALEGEELEEVERLLASGDSEAHELLEKYQNVASHISYSSRGRMPDQDCEGAHQGRLSSFTICLWSSPNVQVPKMIVSHLVNHSVVMLNSFPCKSSLISNISPRALLTGVKLDMKKHCRISFGDYAQVHEDLPKTNTMEPHTV